MTPWNEAAESLADFAAPWKGRVDAIEVYQHPVHTSLRVVKDERDVVLSIDFRDHVIYVTSCTRADDETDEEWLTSPGHLGRGLSTIEQFVEANCPEQDRRRQTLRQLHRWIHWGKMDPLRRYLSECSIVLYAFVEDSLGIGPSFSNLDQSVD